MIYVCKIVFKIYKENYVKFIDVVLLLIYLLNILQVKNINNILINKDLIYVEQMYIIYQYKRYILFILIKKDFDI